MGLRWACNGLATGLRRACGMQLYCNVIASGLQSACDWLALGLPWACNVARNWLATGLRAAGLQ
eukprot:10361009-Alexandrium_andersonii.AAC.1